MERFSLPPEAESIGLKARRFVPEDETEMNGAAFHADTRPAIKATPFRWREPSTIQPREWIYNWHYIRRYLSMIVAAGGTGKTNLLVAEAIAIATGQPILGITPNERTKVWLWNGEDPIEEMERRVMAACLYFGIRREQIEGWLFLDSGRTSPLVIAEQTRDGAKIAHANIEALENTINEHGIGVLTLDPFIAAHRVSENDNNMVNQVARELAALADRTRIAVELSHHIRKTGGAEAAVEDGRGASALRDAARAARAANAMTQAEADGYDIENRRLYFHTFDGKANLAPPLESRTWYKLESVDLGNATPERFSDSVGVVRSWEPPGKLDKITVEHMHEVRRLVAQDEYRKDVQSPKWIGNLVATVANLDPQDRSDRATIKTTINTWLKSGALKVEIGKDSKGNPRPIIVRGDFNGD